MNPTPLNVTITSIIFLIIGLILIILLYGEPYEPQWQEGWDCIEWENNAEECDHPIIAVCNGNCEDYEGYYETNGKKIFVNIRDGVFSNIINAFLLLTLPATLLL